MTDHAPMPVSGYTSQSQSNVDLANEGKVLEELYLRWLDKLDAMQPAVYAGPGPTNPNDNGGILSIDKRCVAEARTCIQTGAMWAIRAIFKPQRVKLPEDN